MELRITPSLPARSFEEITNLVDSLSGSAQMIQIDIVDGIFAPHVSWPFTERDPGAALCALQTITPYVDIEVDCMVIEPEHYLDTLLVVGTSSIIIHLGSTEAYAAISAKLRGVGCSVGLAITNEAEMGAVAELVPLFDFVQVMGIKEVGAQGQPFDERTTSTIQILRAQFPYLTLVVDGAVNTTTLPLLKRAGVNRFAPGSAIAKHEEPKDAYLQLVKLAER